MSSQPLVLNFEFAINGVSINVDGKDTGRAGDSSKTVRVNITLPTNDQGLGNDLKGTEGIIDSTKQSLALENGWDGEKAKFWPLDDGEGNGWDRESGINMAPRSDEDFWPTEGWDPTYWGMELKGAYKWGQSTSAKIEPPEESLPEENGAQYYSSEVELDKNANPEWPLDDGAANGWSTQTQSFHEKITEWNLEQGLTAKGSEAKSENMESGVDMEEGIYGIGNTEW